MLLLGSLFISHWFLSRNDPVTCKTVHFCTNTSFWQQFTQALNDLDEDSHARMLPSVMIEFQIDLFPYWKHEPLD